MREMRDEREITMLARERKREKMLYENSKLTKNIRKNTTLKRKKKSCQLTPLPRQGLQHTIATTVEPMQQTSLPTPLTQQVTAVHMIIHIVINAAERERILKSNQKTDDTKRPLYNLANAFAQRRFKLWTYLYNI